MTVFDGKRIWLVLCGLAALAATGCDMLPTWMPFQEPPSDTMAGVVPPAERIAKLRTLSSEAAKASPDERLKISERLARSIRNERDPLIRLEIIRTLGNYPGPTADAVLKAALRDADGQVRIAACESWGRRRDDQAVKLLADSLTGDVDTDVRIAAAKALGETRNAKAVDPLGEALSDTDPAMQYRAVLSLQQVTGKDLDDDVYRWQQYVKEQKPETQSSLADHSRPMY